jgi:predicted HTH domain antitoxin
VDTKAAKFKPLTITKDRLTLRRVSLRLEHPERRAHIVIMSTLRLEVPRESVASLGANDVETQQVLRLELALALYRDGKLPPGHASELAGINRWEFLDLAKARGIPTPYTKEMLEEDAAHGGSHK